MPISSLIDFGLRHQVVLFTMLGVITARLVSPIVKHFISPTVERSPIVRYLIYEINERLGSRRLSVHTLTVAGISACLIVSISLIGFTNPVPRTAFLHDDSLQLDLSKPYLIILVHGWRGDSQGTWSKFPALLRQDPRFSDSHIITVDYPNFLSRRNLTMGQTASWIDNTLQAQGVEKYQRIAIIAHSIGGLVSRKMILNRRAALRNTVLLIEIGTPHLGAEKYSQLLSVLGIPGGDVTREVAPGSDWLKELQVDWNELSPRPISQCFTSPDDYLVSEDSALFQCDHFQYYPGYGHMDMVKPDNAADDRYQQPALLLNKYLHLEAVSNAPSLPKTSGDAITTGPNSPAVTGNGNNIQYGQPPSPEKQKSRKRRSKP